jgi:hypothetical protein
VFHLWPGSCRQWSESLSQRRTDHGGGTWLFVAWSGNARRTEDAGGDFVVEVDTVTRYVALYTRSGTLVHEAT